MIVVLSLILGFILLAWAAERLVLGASSLADHLGMPPLLIGLTIVAVGTSAPEIVIAIIASWKGSPNLALGTAVGSNIANIGLVLGVTALIAPLRVHSNTLRREYPLLFLIMVLSVLVLLNGQLERLDGWLMLAGLIILLIWLAVTGMHSQKKEPMIVEYDSHVPHKMSLSIAIFWLAVGAILLPLASKIIIDNAVIIAQWFNISDLIIGLTLMALGTSLPEVATSIISALKKEDDIAIGNILGSNMFNLSAVFPFPALLSPGVISPSLLSRDLPVMFAITIFLFVIIYRNSSGSGCICRWQGAFLLSCYFGYIYLLI